MIRYRGLPPQPFRTAWIAGWISFIPLWIGSDQSASDHGVMWLLLLPFPISLAVAGVILAADVNGNTRTMIDSAKEQGATHVSVLFGRLVGAGVAVVAVCMTIAFALGKG